jgi:hypothetical protein
MREGASLPGAVIQVTEARLVNTLTSLMNTGLDRYLGGLATKLVFVSSRGVLPLFVL